MKTTDSQGYELHVAGHLNVKTIDVVILRSDQVEFSALIDRLSAESNTDIGTTLNTEWYAVEDRGHLHIVLTVKSPVDDPASFDNIHSEINELGGNAFLRSQSIEMQGMWVHPDYGYTKPLS